MEQEAFNSELIQNLDFPFENHQVESIESNCGTVWINLKNGVTYYVIISLSESDSMSI